MLWLKHWAGSTYFSRVFRNLAWVCWAWVRGIGREIRVEEREWTSVWDRTYTNGWWSCRGEDITPSEFCCCTVWQGSSTFWVRRPIYIFHIILRAAVIVDYKIIMDILNIIIGAWTAPPQSLTLHCFTYVTAHSLTLPPLYLRHSSFILQPFRCFTYVRGISPTSQFFLQSFRRFTYATPHSSTLQLLHLHHRSFYNPSVASPTSQTLHLASRPCPYDDV